MKPGDVVNTRTLRVHFENSKAKGYIDYKPDKGYEFAVVFIGAFPQGTAIDAVAELKKLGWAPDVDAQ